MMFGSYNPKKAYTSNPYDIESEQTEEQDYVVPDGTKPLTTDMLLRDILLGYPDSAEILMRIGMGCITCPASLMESLGEACMVHGLDGEEVAKYMNQEMNLTDDSDESTQES